VFVAVAVAAVTETETEAVGFAVASVVAVIVIAVEADEYCYFLVLPPLVLMILERLIPVLLCLFLFLMLL